MSRVPLSLRSDERFRKFAVPTYQAFAHAFLWGPPPRVFVNSMPKAGTHLVGALLDALPRMHFSGIHSGINQFRADALAPQTPDDGTDWARIRRVFHRVRAGQYMTGHYPARPELTQLLVDLEFATLFVIRDPRDMVVSNAFYISRLTRHPLHEAYSALTDDQRFTASIIGLPRTATQPGQQSMSERLQAYAGWLDDSGVAVVRFEDLVGAAGGGTDVAQLHAVEEVCRHVHRPVKPAELREISTKVFSTRSATFRKGAIGDWRNHLTSQHLDLVEAEFGDVLTRWGYSSGGPV